MLTPTGDRRRGLLASAAVVLLLTGCAGTDPAPTAASAEPVATTAAPPSPAPFRTSASPAPASSTAAPPGPAPAPPAPAPPSTPHARLPVLAAAAPVSVRIPATGTESVLLSLGLRADGSLEVPPTFPGAPASWYTGSPTPGERGPAVLLGHVNATDGGPGVFAGLRSLAPGDRIEVAREDGSTAVFAVERGEQYPKDAFPTQAVYGNTAGAELRLITCDGYDPATGLFDDNYVVYARLVA
ncbi:class F sortase [Kocuria rosea]|uniref:class F sortase n=1 Tax=Kocuria rosea TaxID=1275 RepID=UPI0020400BB8|nr:class F sortase [Kocuria rosea]MCM3687076.1 class F sortase [Kocuria rosea]